MRGTSTPPQWRITDSRPSSLSSRQLGSFLGKDSSRERRRVAARARGVPTFPGGLEHGALTLGAWHRPALQAHGLNVETVLFSLS